MFVCEICINFSRLIKVVLSGCLQDCGVYSLLPADREKDTKSDKSIVRLSAGLWSLQPCRQRDRYTDRYKGSIVRLSAGLQSCRVCNLADRETDKVSIVRLSAGLQSLQPTYKAADKGSIVRLSAGLWSLPTLDRQSNT